MHLCVLALTITIYKRKSGPYATNPPRLNVAAHLTSVELFNQFF